MKFAAWGLGLLTSFGWIGAPCMADEIGGDDTHAMFGPGFYSLPSYPGAKTHRDLAFPFIDAEYQNRLYTSASDLIGIYGYKTLDTQAGAALLYDLSRRQSSDDAQARDLPNVRSTVRVKLFASQTVGFVTGDANVASDALGHGQGTLAQANLWLTLPLPAKSQISAGPGLTWGNEKYLQTFFAISPAESLLSSLPAYATHAGIVDLHLNVLATFELSSRWQLGASAYFGRLENDAKSSPVTVQRGQATTAGWLAYKFR